MRVLIDSNIPFIKGILEPYADVAYLSGSEFTAELVRDADALIVRTRTRCDERLLGGSAVKMIATATIGTDHIDLEYCSKVGIKVVNAAGCNAGGVMQYVFTALYSLAERKGFVLPAPAEGGGGLELSGRKKCVMGVIGVGNVGGRVADLAEKLGFEVLRCDPLKEREQTLAFNGGRLRLEEFKDYYSLDYLLENSDIVTMHTWLDEKTKGMAGGDFFARMKDGAVFVNASRGEVVDDKALLDNARRFDAVVIDVWNGEPVIDKSLLDVVDIATPHIAGYSYEGKVNGTVMSVRSVADFFDIAPLKGFVAGEPVSESNIVDFSCLNYLQISKKLTGIFPIFEDDFNLRSNPDSFEKLRSNYNYRREFYANPTTKTTNR